MNWQEFTIKDLATHLYWDESNARRILASLCEVDLVEYTGKTHKYPEDDQVKFIV